MRIAIAQLNTRAGDFEATAERMLAFSAAAADQGVELLVFSLAALTGPLPPDYANQEGYLIDLSNTLVHLADSVSCPCIVPVVSDMDGDPMPEAMLLRDGEAVPLRMLSYVSYEREGKAPRRSESVRGRQATDEGRAANGATLELGSMRFGLAFTYDDLDDLYDASRELDAVLYMSAYGYALDDAGSALGAALGENRFKSDAVVLDCWLVAVGSLGGYGMQVFSGSSCVLAPNGELVASAPAFEEALVVADVFPRSERAQMAVEAQEHEIYNRSLHLWEALTLGLHDYLSKTGASDVVVLLDGSVGSCVLAALATDAVGPTHVHAVMADEADEVSRQLVAALHLSPSAHAPILDAIDDEQLRADVCRAVVVQEARTHGAVPLSSEDKTFLALEANALQCRAAALLPLGDVYRSDVIELAHMRNTISPVIPPAVFRSFSVPEIAGLAEAEPTPELRLKRVDTTLATHVEWERSLSDVAARQGERAVTEAILARLREVEAMRVAWPPYLMVSSRTLYDARMPLGIAWRDRMRDEDERLRGEEAIGRISSLLKDDEKPADVPDMAEFLRGLEAELGQGSLPEGVDRKEVESSLGELFGLLQDLAQSGGLTIERPEGGQPPFAGPMGPLTWGSPFSEN